MRAEYPLQQYRTVALQCRYVFVADLPESLLDLRRHVITPCAPD
jgi:hypothetical protein